MEKRRRSFRIYFLNLLYFRSQSSTPLFLKQYAALVCDLRSGSPSSSRGTVVSGSEAQGAGDGAGWQGLRACESCLVLCWRGEGTPNLGWRSEQVSNSPVGDVGCW